MTQFVFVDARLLASMTGGGPSADSFHVKMKNLGCCIIVIVQLWKIYEIRGRLMEAQFE